MCPHAVLHLTPGPHLSACHGSISAKWVLHRRCSTGTRLRVPGASEYCVSKNALSRLIEVVALDELGP